MVKGKFDFEGEEWAEVSKEAKDLIKKMINKPERRLTAQEVLDHKWLKMMYGGDKNQFSKIKNTQ